jgi:hypothetical protein
MPVTFPTLFSSNIAFAGRHPPGRTARGSIGVRARPWSFQPVATLSCNSIKASFRSPCGSTSANWNRLARWLGHPLEQPLQFALRPFSDALERIWQQTLGYSWSAEMGGLSLSGPAKASFDEYVLTLLLHQHPHTYRTFCMLMVAPPEE